MSNIDFGRFLKGAAELASSYVAESAKSLSNNSHLTDEARSQYREISDSFSELRDKDEVRSQHRKISDPFLELGDELEQSPQIDNYEDYSSYGDEYGFLNDDQNMQNQTYTINQSLSQMTFAGKQWYILKRYEKRQKVVLLSKDVILEMPYSDKKESKISTLEKSAVYKWLVNDFKSSLLNKLKPDDEERLLSVSLLSVEEIEEYIPSKRDRIVFFNGKREEWWLKDGKCVTVNGKIFGRKLTDVCGIRPVIVIKLKTKSC